MTELLGLPLDKALERLRALGIETPTRIETHAPRGPLEGGTLRVLSVRDEGRTLIVSAFRDQIDQETQA